MRIGRIWGSRRIRQQAVRLLSLHQAEVRSIVSSTRWPASSLRSGSVDEWSSFTASFTVCVTVFEDSHPVCPVGNTLDLPSAPKALPEVRGFRATPNSNRVLMNYRWRLRSRSDRYGVMFALASGLSSELAGAPSAAPVRIQARPLGGF